MAASVAPPGGVSDQDRSGVCRGLDPGGRVHQVAGDHALSFGPERHRRLAGGHPGPCPQILGTDLHSQRDHGLGQVDGGPHGPFGIVTLGGRRSPHGHDRVSDELLDRTAVAPHDLLCGLEVAPQQIPNLLGIALLRERREADQVGEQDRDEPPLGLRTGQGSGRRRGRLTRANGGQNRGWRSGHRPTTLAAEQALGLVGAAAGAAHQRQRRPALQAELPARSILGPTARTRHSRPLAIQPRERTAPRDPRTSNNVWRACGVLVASRLRPLHPSR